MLHRECHGSCHGSEGQLNEQHCANVTVYTARLLAESAAGAKPKEDCHAETRRCLWLPIRPAKLDKHGLERQFPPALRFISLHHSYGRSVLICDDEGVDACVCVALAATLCRDVDVKDSALSTGGRDMSAVVHGVKASARTGLASISGFHPTARPTRTALKSVYSYVGGYVASRTGASASP